MLGVEARSSLPHDQHNGGDLPGQGQPRHLRPQALGQQSGVELLERTGLARSHDRCALKQILQIVRAPSIELILPRKTILLRMPWLTPDKSCRLNRSMQHHLGP
jgi:hypothetical protein